MALATWRSLEDNPGMLELNAVAERHAGRIVDSRYSFGDADALTNLLVDAGFSDVSVGTHAHGVQFADGALFARLNAMAVIGMSDKGKAMSEAERADLAVNRRGKPGGDRQAHEGWHVRPPGHDDHGDSPRLTPGCEGRRMRQRRSSPIRPANVTRCARSLAGRPGSRLRSARSLPLSARIPASQPAQAARHLYK